MIYDLIIIGAGAAGLFAGASLPRPVNGLIIEKKASPGKKLLMSGAGQCNLTHGGSIKDFISHYGKNGSQIRSILYRFNNQSVMDFFEYHGVPLFIREDQKVFPKSLLSQDALNVLLRGCSQNGLQFCFSTSVDDISFNKKAAVSPEAGIYADASAIYTVQSGNQQYRTKKIIIATGGCSYPATGSDGSIFPVLEKMGIAIVPCTPALVPIFVKEYPYKSLSGISFQNALATIYSGKTRIIENRDAVLLTHFGFSGPGILNLSRYVHPGNALSINYYPLIPEEKIVKDISSSLIGNSKQLLTVLYEYFNGPLQEAAAELPKRFIEAICRRCGIDPSVKASRITSARLKSIINLITQDRYEVLKQGGFEIAMVTAGGVPLLEINTKTMESKKYPNLFFAGEVLDVDGDTGGYNLQFAFSSGHLAAQSIL